MSLFKAIISKSHKNREYITKTSSTNVDYLRGSKAVAISDPIIINCVLDITNATVPIYLLSNLGFSLRAIISNSSGKIIVLDSLSFIDIIIGGVSYPVGTDLRPFDGEVITFSFQSTIATNITTIMLRDGGVTPADALVYDMTLGSEYFSLNDQNGINTVGDLGTIFTRETDNAGGLNYINNNMIIRL